MSQAKSSRFALWDEMELPNRGSGYWLVIVTKVDLILEMSFSVTESVSGAERGRLECVTSPSDVKLNSRERNGEESARKLEK